MELISIIIPIFKVEKYLEECLESVIHQTYKNLEIILVDDGSPDNCPSICDKYALMDTRIKVIHQENQGLSAARNTGIKYATGEYIFFLDSDDYLNINYCEKIINVAKNVECDIVISKIVTIDDEGKLIQSGLGLNISEQKLLNNCDAMRGIILGRELQGYAWGKLYKRSFVEEIKYPVGKVFEDRYTVYKYFEKANRVCLCPEAIIYYRLRKSSITHNLNLSKWYDLLEADKNLLLFCEKKYPEILNQMKAIYFGRYIHIWIYFFDSQNQPQITKFVGLMKDIYRKYRKVPDIKLVHKISYLMIFYIPNIYRWLIHKTNFDMNER